jgi:thiamine biosynthesis lipoprotein
MQAFLNIPVLIFVTLLFSHTIQTKPSKVYIISGNAQGTTYQITYLEKDSTVAKIQIDSIFNTIDSSLSLYKPYSLINKFNKSEWGCELDDHFFNVVKKAIQAYKETNGSFDITVKRLVQAWGFGATKNNNKPDSNSILALQKCTGTYMLKLDKTKLRKQKPCVQIDCNGIAQGYTVDVISNFLEKNNITNYMVELGGEIRVKGNNQLDKKWRVGIEMPGDNPDFIPAKHTIHFSSGAVTTSGNYRNFFVKDGKTYSHLIDPGTGYPVDNGMISVTVIAKDAITADAFDNGFMIMGVEKSLSFLADKKDMEAYFVYKKEDGTISDTATSGFYKYLNNKN